MRPERATTGDDGVMRRCMAHLRRGQKPIVTALGILLSLIALAVIVRELSAQGMAPLRMLAQAGPLFWIVFVGGLMVEPVTEFAILRRVIGVERDVFPALVRKQALNNLLFGYAGDTYFAAWLHQHIGDVRRAFAAVCDLAIASALVNNIATVLLLMLVWEPIQGLAGARLDGWAALACVALVALPMALVAWRRMRTPRGHMVTILGFQAGRTVTATLLLALTWHLALPEVSLLSWTMLLAARMVVSRLPILPNKDLAFAGIISLFMQGDDRIAPMIGAVALLSLVSQGVLILLQSLSARQRLTGLRGQGLFPISRG